MTFQPFLGFTGVWTELFTQRPEFRAMVHFAQMRDLMGSEIIDDPIRSHDDTPRKAQVSIVGTGAPAAACILHADGPQRPPGSTGMNGNQPFQIGLCFLFQEGRDPPS